MAENPALEAAMETYRRATRRLMREAKGLEDIHAPLGARKKRYEAHLVKRAAVAEVTDPRPPGLPSEVTE